MKNTIILLSLLMAFQLQAQNSKMTETIKFSSEDGLMITADLYMIDQEAPWIILYHQAGFSRGEYLEIAPRLNEWGFNCLATDQRSGNEVNGILNETHKRAVEKDLKTAYIDATPDLIASLNYAKNQLKAKEIIIWGSSYSAALTFYLASQYPEDIKAIIAFSPGEYFKIGNKSIADFAAQVQCPVFITSARDEEANWKDIYEVLSGEKYYYLSKDEGFHGSRALWSDKEGHEMVWKEVERYLKSFRNRDQ